MTTLPIDEVLTPLSSALATHGAAVLQAPPGAGKTTRVPLALRGEGWLKGQRILMLEPRRVAARAAAAFMARSLGEQAGDTVGYRTRLDTRVGAKTVIEVVTEGILTRMLVNDPGLESIGLVIFDEFHERSLHADEGLALTLALRRALRPDLKLLVMSATLDGDRVAALLGDAPVITSTGRSWPVEIEYLPPREGRRIEMEVASAVRRALDETEGDILVFLPGAGEIRRTGDALSDLSQGKVAVTPLHGTLPPAQQDLALLPDASGRRKVILSTSIAESSVTIDGVRVVVDSGLSRTARFSPRTGLTRLVTTRVSRASSEQRAGRAGRQAPGTCYRLWPAHEQAMLQPFTLPEILEADLAPLVLDLAAAGAGPASSLDWLDPPPASHLQQAHALLEELGVLTPDGAPTAHGRAIEDTGLHPRLGHMLLTAREFDAGPLAAVVAALLEERDIVRGEGGPSDPDFRLRVEAVLGRTIPASAGRISRDGVDRVRRHAQQLTRKFFKGDTPAGDTQQAGLIAALAFPDRVAKRREGSARFLLRNGRGAALATAHALAGHEFIVALDLDDQGAEGRVYLAAPLELTEIEGHFADAVTWHDEVSIDDDGVIAARRTRQLGAIVLDEQVARTPDQAALLAAITSHLARKGLASIEVGEAFDSLRVRLAFLHALDPSWPAVDDSTLAARVVALAGERGMVPRRMGDLGPLLREALEGQLDWKQRAELDRLAPTHMEVPSGSRIAVSYSDPLRPVLAVRLQEMFGAATTPTVGGGRVPLTLHLLSPAHRPVQVTQDLGGFWRTSYAEVRKEMRGRYPKHVWPDDPLTAEATRKAKPRKR